MADTIGYLKNKLSSKFLCNLVSKIQPNLDARASAIPALPRASLSKIDAIHSKIELRKELKNLWDKQRNWTIDLTAIPNVDFIESRLSAASSVGLFCPHPKWFECQNLEKALTEKFKKTIPNLKTKLAYPHSQTQSFFQTSLDEASNWEHSKQWASILEPKTSLNAAFPDLLFIPGLLFSSRGDRLGRGHGFYDRYLAQALRSKSVFCVGLCHESQIIETFKDSLKSEHDIPMDALLSSQNYLELYNSSTQTSLNNKKNKELIK